jgi:hypothetical protein
VGYYLLSIGVGLLGGRPCVRTLQAAFQGVQLAQDGARSVSVCEFFAVYLLTCTSDRGLRLIPRRPKRPTRSVQACPHSTMANTLHAVVPSRSVPLKLQCMFQGFLRSAVAKCSDLFLDCSAGAGSQNEVLSPNLFPSSDG